MTFPFLSDPKKIIGWARHLIDSMNRRDAEIERRLKALEKTT